MTVLATYPSSSGNSVHQVRLGDDGVVYCTCPGWRLHNKRRCKHLTHYERTRALHRQTAPEHHNLHKIVSPVERATDEVIELLKGGVYGNE